MQTHFAEALGPGLRIADSNLREDESFDALSYGPVASTSFQIAASISAWIPGTVLRWLARLERIRERLREVLDQLAYRGVAPGTVHGATHNPLWKVLAEKHAWLETNLESLVTALAAIGADFYAGPNPLAEGIGLLLDAFGECRASPKALLTQIRKLKKGKNKEERDRKVAGGTPSAQADAEETAANQATDSALGGLVNSAPSWIRPNAGDNR